MTEQQKKDILRFRDAGMSYRQISERTGISVSSIKTMVFRQKQTPARDQGIRCKWCGKIVPQPDTARVRHFCNRRCYVRWWQSTAEHPRTVYDKECAYCGKPFQSISNKKQKYCSADCYHAARKAGAAL